MMTTPITTPSRSPSAPVTSDENMADRYPFCNRVRHIPQGIAALRDIAVTPEIIEASRKMAENLFAQSAELKKIETTPSCREQLEHLARTTDIEKKVGKFYRQDNDLPTGRLESTEQNLLGEPKEGDDIKLPFSIAFETRLDHAFNPEFRFGDDNTPPQNLDALLREWHRVGKDLNAYIPRDAREVKRSIDAIIQEAIKTACTEAGVEVPSIQEQMEAYRPRVAQALGR